MTLKQFTTLLLSFILAFAAEAQNYSNIEFIENKGQWDSRVKYKGNVNAGALFIRSGGFTVLQYNQQDYDKMRSLVHGHTEGNTETESKTVNREETVTLRGHAYNVDFVGAAPDMQIMPDKIIQTYNNYFLGDDPSKWAGECHIYQAITLSNVYPGIDVRYYTYNGTLKYDIVARPGADIGRIALKYEGADKLQVKNKELVVSTSVGDLRESYPYSYQSDGKEKKDVNCKYSIKDNIVRFDIKNYDHNATLVIDPSLVFCSFSGSVTDNWGFTATYGPDGSMFGGGIVFDNGFPVDTGAFQTTYGGGDARDHPGPIDIAIIKLSPNGANKVYATYIGGTGNEQPHSLIVNSAGNLIVSGRTNSPLTGSGAYPVSGGAAGLVGPCGGYDIIVTELNAAGSGLIGSKRIGGTGVDGVNITIANSSAFSLDRNYGDGSRSEVILDGGGNVYVASSTQSSSSNLTDKFPVTPGAFQQNFGGGTQDGVVLKFDPTLSTCLFSSFLGGNNNDAAYVLSIAPSGNIYVAGGTESSDATFLPGTHAGTWGPVNHGGIDGFVAEISNNGSTVIRSTFIGTNGIDQIYGIQFDRNGFPYVMGQTTGNWDALVVNAPYNVPGSKQFICKLQPDLSAFVYSTNFGTPSSIPNISPTAFLVDRCENVYVSGWGGRVTNGYPNAGTTGMYVSPDAYKSTSPDNSDFYFFVLRKNAVAPPLYGSFFGQDGGFTDHVDGGTSRFDANGAIYQAICANCGGGVRFPTTIGSAYPNHNAALAFCNLAMVKMSFNLAGVGVDVQSAIGGVPNDTAGCLPLQVVFTDQIRNAVQYIWNFGDGPDVGPLSANAPDNGYTQTHTYNAVGTYTVMLVAIDPTSCNVRDTSYIHIRVGDLKANLAASYEKLDPCEQFNYRFHNLSTTDVSRPFTNTSFIWDFGDGSPRVVAGMNDVDHTYPVPNITYHARLILNDTAYCNDPDSITIDVRVSANVKARFDTPPVGCAPYSAEFINTSDGGLTVQWDFGDPGSGADNTSTAVNVATHLYNSPGNYTITMIVNDPNTCNKTDTTKTTIVVYEKPQADFSYTPVTPVENTPDIFTNLSSSNATRFKWVFGDGDTLSTTSRSTVQHQYNSTGTFNACLIAFNDVGCSDTACHPVSTIIVPVLDVPNAFTPNSGNVNSKVFVRGFGIAKMRFIIWNRWGQKVFETNDRFEGWDGKVKGVVQPMDVYVYTLDVEFFDKTKTTRKGDITLIR